MSVGGVELRERFGYHPATPDTGPKHDSVRQLCLGLAFQLDGLVPDGRDKSLALTALEEVMHWANAAIAKKAPLA
jgi:hypothetical protein